MRLIIFLTLLIFMAALLPAGQCEGLNEKWQRRVDELDQKWENMQKELEDKRDKSKAGHDYTTVKRILPHADSWDEEAIERIPKVPPGPFTPQTSIILNAADFNISPSLKLKVIGRKNNDVYTALPLYPSYLLKYGPVGFADSIEQAKSSPRSGLNPLLVDVIKYDQSNGLTLWINDTELTKKQQVKVKSFFQKCAVMVVL